MEAPPAATPPVRNVSVPNGPSRTESAMLARFQAEVARQPKLDYAGFVREAGVTTPKDVPLEFDPTKVRFYEEIAKTLRLTDEEKRIFKGTGVVAVDHVKPYSIGGIYQTIYAQELPVLITTDSVLHALHRSYDNILAEIESVEMLPVLDASLGAAHEVLAKQQSELASPPLADSAADVDVYLTVARSLASGRPVPSKLGRDPEVKTLLDKIGSLAPASDTDRTVLYGGSRVIDFSQFRPRGHYTKSEALQRYFRLMMWLGRADIGFIVDPPDPRAGLDVDAGRETRSAGLLAWTLRASGKLAEVRRTSDMIDFLVGASDNVTLDETVLSLDESGLQAPAAFADAAKLSAFATDMGTKADQNIRSQFVEGSSNGDPVKLPKLFQLFGQRFTIDSFVMGQVVYDSIPAERLMPSGLDVMAALGNDEAARLLKPEIEKYGYGPQLRAARHLVSARSKNVWEADVYDLWVDALRSLNTPPTGTFAPSAMQGEAWRRKTLETQLSSWSQLRHDTILYVKQTYSSHILCGYPAGFVEPYPDFYAKVSKLGRRAAARLGPTGHARAAEYFTKYADVMDLLERMAKKELASKPFTTDEEDFLKKTIDASGGGCGGPEHYDGWYTSLIYGEDPDRYHPTIADVHTDPNSGNTLEVGIGNASFVVVAVDNGADRAAYVGPISSYYAFPSAHRLTDEEWQAKLQAGDVPPRPEFTSAYRTAGKPRDFEWNRPRVGDPRVNKLRKEAEHKALTPEQRAKKQQELYQLMDRLRNPPMPGPDGKAPAPRR